MLADAPAVSSAFTTSSASIRVAQWSAVVPSALLDWGSMASASNALTVARSADFAASIRSLGEAANELPAAIHPKTAATTEPETKAFFKYIVVIPCQIWTSLYYGPI